MVDEGLFVAGARDVGYVRDPQFEEGEGDMVLLGGKARLHLVVSFDGVGGIAVDDFLLNLEVPTTSTHSPPPRNVPLASSDKGTI